MWLKAIRSTNTLFFFTIIFLCSVRHFFQYCLPSTLCIQAWLPQQLTPTYYKNTTHTRSATILIRLLQQNRYCFMIIATTTLQPPHSYTGTLPQFLPHRSHTVIRLYYTITTTLQSKHHHHHCYSQQHLYLGYYPICQDNITITISNTHYSYSYNNSNHIELYHKLKIMWPRYHTHNSIFITNAELLSNH